MVWWFEAFRYSDVMRLAKNETQKQLAPFPPLSLIYFHETKAQEQPLIFSSHANVTYRPHRFTYGRICN